MPLIVKTLEPQLYQAAYEGFIASFLDSPAQDGDAREKQADAFAKKFSEIAAMAIDTYIKTGTVNILTGTIS